MRKLILLCLGLLFTVAKADNTSSVSRLQLDHPNLGHTGGAALHTHIGDIYTKLGDNIGTRYKEYTGVADSAVTTFEHNLNIPFTDMIVVLWSDVGASKTRIENPSASGWTIAATSGFVKTKIDITAPGSGGPHSFSVEVHSGLRALAAASTSNVSMTGNTITGLSALNLTTTTVTDTLKYQEPGGSDYAGIVAPSLSAPYTLTLPADDGSANDVLKVDGSGGLSFGKVANANVDAAAGITYSKLNLSNSIVNGDVNASAGIVYSKLNLLDSIVNADVSGSASIEYSKLNLSNSIQNIDIANGANINATKLATGVVDNTEFNRLNGVTGDIQTQLDGKLNLSGGVMTGNITLAGDASSALHPVTKQQFDAGLNGIAWKQPVRAASTVSGTLATDFENGDSVGGVTLATNDAILIKEQSTSSENGIYTVNASGAPTRRADADAYSELNGAAVIVSEGTLANRGYYQSVELTSFSGQSWFQNFGTGLYLADGNGIELSGSTFSLELDGTTLSKSATGLKVEQGNLTLDNIGGTLSVSKGGTGSATASGARTNLVAAQSGANSDITSLSGLTTPLSVLQGGTGSGTASGARSNLSAAQSGANSDITSLSGLTTPLSVLQGGTGSATASGARTNLVAAQSGANSDITSLNSGNIGIGTTTPGTLFGVGSSSQFRVSSTGDLTRIKNIPYVWPSTQGDESTTLTNDGAGNLTWSEIPPGTPQTRLIHGADLITAGTSSESFWNRQSTFKTQSVQYKPIIWATGFGAGALYYSLDDANTWTQVSGASGLTIETVYAQGPLVFVGLNNGVGVSRDYGNTFTTTASGTSNLPTGPTLNAQAVNGRFFVTGNGGLSWSDDLTTWTAATGITLTDKTRVFYDDAGTLVTNNYLGTSYKSSDNGATWTTLSTTGIGSVRTLNAGDAKIFACTSTGFWRSEDLGANWEQADTNSCYQSIVIGDRYYTSEASQYLRVSIDGGLNWTSKDLGTYFYAGAVVGRRIYIDGDVTMKYSDDDGVTFNTVPTEPTGSNKFELFIQGGANWNTKFDGSTRDFGMKKQRLFASATSCTTGNVTTDPLKLGPGRWEIEGYVGFDAGGSITAKAALSTTSATLPGNETLGVSNAAGEISTQETISTRTVLPLLKSEVFLTATTTNFYLICNASSATNAWGSIKAVQK